MIQCPDMCHRVSTYPGKSYDERSFAWRRNKGVLERPPVEVCRSLSALPH